ncbi:MAG: hypothetical protein KIS96_03630 [Bauldia sp.]|nr:hypothetical protein [Bauldia sp.]
MWDWPAVLRSVRRHLDRNIAATACREPGHDLAWRQANALWLELMTREMARRAKTWSDHQAEQKFVDKAKAKAATKAARRKPVSRGPTDTITFLIRRGDLDVSQQFAADRYRDAWDACHASLQGTLNPDRVGGGGDVGRPLSPREVEGAAIINLASRILGDQDGAVLHLIVGEGHTIVETAKRLYGPTPTRREKETIGIRLREALIALGRGLARAGRQAAAERRAAAAASGEADEERKPLVKHPLHWMAEETEPVPAKTAGPHRRTIAPGKVAHADRRGVTYSKRKGKAQ